MSVKENTVRILKELSQNVNYENDQQLDQLVEAIKEAKHIFLAGAGRSGVAIQGFTNRLLHLGYSVSIVGEISSPHSHKGDLLIIGSGSGETESLVQYAKKAKMAGIKVALITMDEQSTLGKIADVVVILPGVSPKLKHIGIKVTSIQPMGSAFEQIAFLTYDGIILELMNELGESTETMAPRHADFE